MIRFSIHCIHINHGFISRNIIKDMYCNVYKCQLLPVNENFIFSGYLTKRNLIHHLISHVNVEEILHRFPQNAFVCVRKLIIVDKIKTNFRSSCFSNIF